MLLNLCFCFSHKIRKIGGAPSPRCLIVGRLRGGTALPIGHGTSACRDLHPGKSPGDLDLFRSHLLSMEVLATINC